LVATYGGTGYYKIAGTNLGGTGSNTAVKTVASIDIDRNSCEQNRVATISGIMAGSSKAMTANEKYPGYHCTSQAYGYYKFGTAQYKTDCLNQFAYIQTIDTADGLVAPLFGESTINRDSHCRTVIHVATAAKLLRGAGASSDATTMIDQCDVWAKAFFDNLNSGNPAPTLRFSGWDANNTTGFNAQTVWQATHAYSLGEVRRPTSTNNRTYRVTTAGTSAGSEPTWPTTDGGTVTDGIRGLDRNLGHGRLLLRELLHLGWARSRRRHPDLRPQPAGRGSTHARDPRDRRGLRLLHGGDIPHQSPQPHRRGAGDHPRPRDEHRGNPDRHSVR
jgi:hypothetical protein